MTYIVTNPQRRCLLCNAREVIEIDEEREEVVETSLIGADGNWMCANSDECQQNIEADNTEFIITEGGTGVHIKRFGETLLNIQMGDS